MDEAPPITLEQYATVSAGLADRLELIALLEHVGVSPRDWERGQDHWVEAILDDLDDGAALSMEVDALQRQARAAWARRVPPLDEDLRAWLDFQRGLAEQDDPAAYLESLSLTAGDLGTLTATWGRRMGEDDTLRKQAEEILAKPPEPVEVPLPPPMVLPGKATQSPDGTGFYAPFIEDDEAVPFRGEREAGLRIAPPLSTPLPAPPKDDGQDLDGTALGAEPVSFRLPFQEATESASEEPDAEGIGETAFLDASALGLDEDPLPFEAGTANMPPPASYKTRDDFGQTDDAAEPPPREHVLPFRDPATPQSAAPEAVPRQPPQEATSGVDATAFVDATALGLDDDALPFSEQRGAQAQVASAEIDPHEATGETSFLDAASLGLDEAPMPFQSPAQRQPATAPLAPGLPHTLTQYAAVCVELELAPAQRAQILMHYGLTEETLGQLERARQSRIAADATVASAWERARAEYAAWRAKR